MRPRGSSLFRGTDRLRRGSRPATGRARPNGLMGMTSSLPGRPSEWYFRAASFSFVCSFFMVVSFLRSSAVCGNPAQIYQLFSGFSYSVPYSPFRAVPSACPYGFPVRRYGRCGMFRTSCTPPVRGAGAFSGHFSRFSAGERGVASIASDGDGVRKFRSIYGKHSIVIMNCE